MQLPLGTPRPTVLQLPARTKLAFSIAGALYVVGAVGMELLEDRHAEVHGLLNPTSVALATAEESLELAALVLFIWALLGYIADRHGEVQLRFERGAGRRDRWSGPGPRREGAGRQGVDHAGEQPLGGVGDPALGARHDEQAALRHAGEERVRDG